MKDINSKKSFEKGWESAFKGAEKAPPEAVWNRLESHLNQSETKYFKKKVVIFKWVAAASLAFALGLGINSLYLNTNRGQLAEEQAQHGQNETTENSPLRNSETRKVTPQEGLANNSGQQNQKGTVTKGLDGPEVGDPRLVENQKSLIAVVENEENFAHLNENMEEEGLSTEEERSPVGIIGSNDIRLLSSSLFAGNAIWKTDLPDHLYMVPIMPLDYDRNREPVPTEFMAGVSFSTGRFDPRFEDNSIGGFRPTALSSFSGSDFRMVSNAAVTTDAQISNETYSSDVSYSYGVNMGARFSKRFIVQGGLSYMKANSTATTDAYLEDFKTGSRYAILKASNYQAEGLHEVKQGEQVQLQNNFEFASLPVKVGYILLDRKLNVIVNSGISSDFYLGNTISAQDDFLSSFKENKGEDSPFHKVYFNGLFGTTVGYVLADHYHLSLEPSYRLALSSLTKDNFPLSSKPSSFYITFGLNYRFR